jgi:pimeloyl-ACP methyl ester carboxylesterase
MLKKLTPKIYGFLLNFQSLFSKKTASKNAFQVYCNVRKGKVLAEQKAFLNDAKHEFVQLSDHTIQSYNWPGKGKNVLLVHGWESNSYRWRILIEKLQKADFNVFSFDAPAHGYSTGTFLNHPLYESTLQSIIQKYAPSYLIGHSMGGMTIMYNQYLHHDSAVEKIVTIASPSEYHELMRFYKKLLSLSKRVVAGLEDHLIAKFGFSFKEFSTTQFAKTNTKTGLLIHDRFDPITPYWSSEQVHSNWADSTFITTEGLGHSIQDNHINDQIVSFLKS